MVKVKVDFSDVEDGPKASRVEPGDYILVCKKAEKAKASSGNTMVNFELKVKEPASAKGSTVYHTSVLTPKSLWNLRNIMIAMGLKAPKKALTIDLDDFKGKAFGATVDDEEYEGKTRSKIVDTWKVGERKIGAGKKSKKAKDDDEDEEDEDDEDEDDDDEDEDDDEDLEDMDDL
jgi:Protein of unknown function (DUF669)